jgi:hypothetical protein
MSTHLIVTSIAPPQKVLSELAKGCQKNNINFIVIGDVSSPKEFKLEGCDYYDIGAQKKLSFKYAENCPVKHYARKNIGYLLAIKKGAEVIIETDDDNFPREGFWSKRESRQNVNFLENAGWYNVYSYFSDNKIWPRGFPLELLQKQVTIEEKSKLIDCPIQQGLADENPDVDAIYRLTMTLPQNFKKGKLALGENTWCPFNSQNTTFFKEAFPLLYLPATCSFRMTDIWRSFIAQRIAWENNWHILFHEATVWQERNEHNLLKDFADEVPGYLNNSKICNELEKLYLKKGIENIADNMLICYKKLVDMDLMNAKEMELLNYWLEDLANLKA